MTLILIQICISLNVFLLSNFTPTLITCRYKCLILTNIFNRFLLQLTCDTIEFVQSSNNNCRNNKGFNDNDNYCDATSIRHFLCLHISLMIGFGLINHKTLLLLHHYCIDLHGARHFQFTLNENLIISLRVFCLGLNHILTDPFWIYICVVLTTNILPQRYTQQTLYLKWV